MLGIPQAVESLAYPGHPGHSAVRDRLQRHGCRRLSAGPRSRVRACSCTVQPPRARARHARTHARPPTPTSTPTSTPTPLPLPLPHPQLRPHPLAAAAPPAGRRRSPHGAIILPPPRAPHTILVHPPPPPQPAQNAAFRAMRLMIDGPIYAPLGGNPSELTRSSPPAPALSRMD